MWRNGSDCSLFVERSRFCPFESLKQIFDLFEGDIVRLITVTLFPSFNNIHTELETAKGRLNQLFKIKSCVNWPGRISKSEKGFAVRQFCLMSSLNYADSGIYTWDTLICKSNGLFARFLPDFGTTTLLNFLINKVTQARTQKCA